VQRSLAIDYTHDQKIYDGQFHNQYLFGPYFLVAPVESDKQFVKVYLPEGNWYSLYTGQRYTGQAEYILECPLHKLPVWVRAGALIPMQPAKSHSQETTDLLILHVYTGGDSSFTFYEDDGATFAYQQGEFAIRELSCRADRPEIRIAPVIGTYRTNLKRLKVVFHGPDFNPQTLTVNGKSAPAVPSVHTFFAELEKFDPFYNPEPTPQEAVHSIELDYTPEQFILQW
jgi:alpha-glucosidase